MNISLENWIRNKLQENEEMQDYAVATETVRVWIDEYNQFSKNDVDISVCDHEKSIIKNVRCTVCEYCHDVIEIDV